MSYSRRQAWFALGVLFAINLMNFYDRQIIAAVTEPIRKEWNLSDTDMGILGTAFVLIYAAVGVPLGRLSDRFSRTRILSGGVTVWSLLTALSGATWNYASMFAARLGVGVGEASCAGRQFTRGRPVPTTSASASAFDFHARTPTRHFFQ